MNPRTPIRRLSPGGDTQHTVVNEMEEMSLTLAEDRVEWYRIITANWKLVSKPVSQSVSQPAGESGSQTASQLAGR